MKLKKGDTIIVTAGKDRGRTGVVERVFLQDELVMVPGLNQYKKHRKPQGEQPGEIVTLSRALSMGKVALMCPKCKLVTRVGYRLDGDRKLRICRKCKNDIDEVKVQKSKGKAEVKEVKKGKK